ncbi:class I SAM-dependent methyltransferase [Veronia pacifica]|uniref:Methyltransferase n=1 Tax=Veronia pacifica TaxID=1080227 RepID=A0A1C3EAE1_9GAMM|nr:class I SAM-dependent methyltransferase [Veronia pacifica]ODA30227.1 hypothetical protein A8L45_20710 [Veronia pacifica]
MKKTVTLGSVQETLLIPLLGRAQETSRPNGLLSDPRAQEIIDQLDYDFSKWRGDSSLAVACVRTRIFDDIALRFLEKYPDGTIVEIGCGLNTRFERIDNGLANWFELDLSDSIALRRSFFSDQPRRTMIEGSVLDKEWIEPVVKLGKPTLFLSEAVLIYLEEHQVKQAIVQIADAFPEAWFVTDMCKSSMTTAQAHKKNMARFGVKTWFKWACDDPTLLTHWHHDIAFVSTQSIADASPDIVAKMPFIWRTLLRVTPFIVRYLMKDYCIAQYRLGK